MGPGAPLILVVEDNADIRELLLEFLEGHGYEVDVSAHGGEALQRLCEGRLPDLVLLDLTMPVMDGWALRNALLKDPAWKGLPVIVISALSDGLQPPDIAASLAKPIDLDLLLATLERLLTVRSLG